MYVHIYNSQSPEDGAKQVAAVVSPEMAIKSAQDLKKILVNNLEKFEEKLHDPEKVCDVVYVCVCNNNVAS